MIRKEFSTLLHFLICCYVEDFPQIMLSELKSMLQWYIAFGVLSNFGTTFEINKNSNYDRNQFKISTQNTNMYAYLKKL